jgi:hypothetical protein
VDLKNKSIFVACLAVYFAPKAGELFTLSSKHQRFFNEKDSPTFDLTVRPLSGAVPAGLLLNSNGGAKVIMKFRKKTLFLIVILCP